MRALLFFLPVLFFCAPAHANSFSDALAKETIRLDPKVRFRLVKDQQLGGEMSRHIIIGETTEKLRVEITVIRPVSGETAKLQIDSEVAAIQKLYAAPETPYMGDIAQAIGGCSSLFSPLLGEADFLGANRKTIVAAAKKFDFGACSSQEATYMGAFLGYQQENKLFFWRIFKPWPRGTHKISSTWLPSVLDWFKR